MCRHTNKDNSTSLGLGKQTATWEVKLYELLKQYPFAFLSDQTNYAWSLGHGSYKGWHHKTHKKRKEKQWHWTGSQNMYIWTITTERRRSPRHLELTCCLWTHSSLLSCTTLNVQEEEKYITFRINRLIFVFCVFYLCKIFLWLFCFYCENSLMTSKWRFIMKQ